VAAGVGVKVTVGAVGITDWCHAVVSKQIAVRLPDEIASLVDAEVAAGHAPITSTTS
jgi:hypothetical protein